MSVFDIIKESKKEPKPETLTFRLTKKNVNFLNILKDITGNSRNELINKIIKEYQEEYDKGE